MKQVITFGTFDLFHIGHLRILERARALGDKLSVGISSDVLTYEKKGRHPFYSYEERRRIVSALRCVDYVFEEVALEKKREYLVAHKGHILVMGDDWQGKFDEFSDIVEVVYLSRTPSISTTAIIERTRVVPR